MFEREKIRLLNIFWTGALFMFSVGALLSYFDNKPLVVQQYPIRFVLFIMIYMLMRFKKIQAAMYLLLIGLFTTSFYTAFIVPHQSVFPLICIVLVAVSYYIIDSKIWNISFLIISIASFLYLKQYQIINQVPVFDTSYIVAICFVFLSIFMILWLYKLEQSRLTAELEHQNQKLQHMDKVKNNLLSILSHDLRSPLVSITSLLTLILEEDEIKNSELFEMFDSIKNRSDLTLHLMDQILNWAHTQVEGFQLNRHEITVKNIFTEEMMMLETQIDLKKPIIKNEIPDDITVYADLQIFKTVIRNIISNALKYINDGDEIVFSANKANKGTNIIVSDNGIGIEEKRLQSLFHEKIDAEPGTQNEMGTGLGLFISNDFIQMHAGKIMIESELSQGTVVTTFWPHKNSM